MPASKFTPAEIEIIIKRIENGESLGSVAASTGMYKSCLGRLIKRKREGFSFDKYWSATLKVPADPAQIGYMAGLIDGEGSIIFTGNKSEEETKRGWGWQVKIGMTDENVINWLHSWGGSKSKMYQAKGNRKPSWQWIMARRKDVKLLLETVLPHLIVKRERAIEALSTMGDVVNGDDFTRRNDKWRPFFVTQAGLS